MSVDSERSELAQPIFRVDEAFLMIFDDILGKVRVGER